MNETISIFESRKAELDLYFSVMHDIDQGLWKTHDNSTFFKLLKSNFILMLYNLIEACVINGIAEIYDELKQDGCSYNDVIDEIKTIWRNRQIANVYNRSAEKKSYDNKVKEIIDAILSNAPITLSREELRHIGGNLDDQKIMDLCNKHHIRYVVQDNHDKLQIVRRKRNDLAHGDVSFGDCARDLTLSDLEEIKDAVLLFMQSIIDGMKDYYNAHGYRINAVVSS